TVLSILVPRVRSASGPDASRAWSGKCGAGYLTPTGTRCGLDAPMPRPITPVNRGRCRPSPDRVPLGAPANRDARRIVTGSLAVLAGERLLPVLGAPPAGVGRVHRDDRDAGRVGHRGQARAQPAGRHTADQLPKPLAASVLLAGLVRPEVQVLDRDGPHA